MIKLNKSNYEIHNELEGQNDINILEEFSEYDGGEYIGDVIGSISDSNVGIYDYEILDKAKGLHYSGAYEEASASGLLEGTNDLVRHLQMAWYEYNQTVLYDNLEDLIYNYAIDILNEKKLENLTTDQINLLDDHLEIELSNMDSNNTFDDIVEATEQAFENFTSDKESN